MLNALIIIYFSWRYLFRKALLEDGLAQAEAAERKAKLAEAAAVSPVKESVEPTTIQPKVAGSKAIAHSKSNSELSSRPSTISLHEELSQQVKFWNKYKKWSEDSVNNSDY